MERHLQSSRKFAVFIGALALSLLLGACGGGGGGGSGGSRIVQATGMTSPDMQRTTATDSNASAPSANDQVTTLTNPDTKLATPPETSTSSQSGQNQLTATTGLVAEVTTPPETGASAQQVGSTSLRWQPPSQRVDGESLSMSEIAGYRIFYGTRSGDYDSVLSVDDPYTSTILIDDLPVGTYYFVMTTVDTSGIESSYSREAVKIVQS
jgi:hypothetical protein